MCKLPSLRWSYKHSIKMCIHSVENNFPPVASVGAEENQHAAANFNLSKIYLLLITIFFLFRKPGL